MYTGNIKVVANDEKELKTLIQTIRICGLDRGIKFSIEKCAMFTIKDGKTEAAERRKLLN